MNYTLSSHEFNAINKIAEKYDMSVRQIKNIVYKNEYTIYRHIWHI